MNSRLFSRNKNVDASIFGILVILLGAVSGFAQSIQQSAPTKQTTSAPATLRVTSRAVQVSIVVQGKDGQPISGLTKADFTLFDKGERQQISSFVERSSHLVTTVADGTPAPPSSNSFSNQRDSVDESQSVTVILLDALNTDFGDMTFARGQVVKFLRQVQPRDRIALYGLTSRILILHDFTSDTATLLRALDQASKKVTSTGKPVASGSTAFAEFSDVNSGMIGGDLGWLVKGLAREEIFNQTNKVEQTAEAFKAIANHLANVPGRKNLVWVSGSFPINMGYGSIGAVGVDKAQFAGDIEKAVEALSNANVAVYPVNARGLTAPGLPVGAARSSAASDSMIATMQSFAQGTGGLAFYNTNDIGGAIRRAIDDGRATYELSYYPTHDQWNGAFREIKITANHPGVHLRYRSGYFATSSASGSVQHRKELLADAVHSPLEFTEIALDVQADGSTHPDGRSLVARVRVDPGQLHFAENNGHWTDNVDVVWVSLDAEGKSVGTMHRLLRLNIPQQAYEDIMRRGLTFSQNLPLSNEAVEMRLVTSDTGSGAIGSLNIPLTRIFAQVSAKPGTKN
jgi:VWFA-related protein